MKKSIFEYLCIFPFPFLPSLPHHTIGPYYPFLYIFNFQTSQQVLQPSSQTLSYHLIINNLRITNFLSFYVLLLSPNFLSLFPPHFHTTTCLVQVSQPVLQPPSNHSPLPIINTTTDLSTKSHITYFLFLLLPPLSLSSTYKFTPQLLLVKVSQQVLQPLISNQIHSPAYHEHSHISLLNNVQCSIHVSLSLSSTLLFIKIPTPVQVSKSQPSKFDIFQPNPLLPTTNKSHIHTL